MTVTDPTRAAELADLRRQVTTTMQDLHTEVGQARSLADRGRLLTAEVERFGLDRETAERVSGVLSKLASDRDQAARAQVESLVTAGLQAIFGDGGEVLTFHLVESTLRNAANIDFEVHTTKPDGTEIVTDVMSARGGGVAAVIGMLLRVVLILLTRQTGQKVSSTLVLDETLAMLSADRLEAASAFLRTLVDSAGLQVIMVTHQTELTESADKVYRVSLRPDGVSQVTKILG
jgi:DNA repair exonuclease SbcCD ATPase subunit